MFKDHLARNERTFYRTPGRRVLWVLAWLLLTGFFSVNGHAEDSVPVDLHVNALSHQPAPERACSAERRNWFTSHVMTIVRVSCHRSWWLPAEAPLQLSGGVGAKVFVGRHVAILPEIRMKGGVAYLKASMEVRFVF